MTRTVVHKEPSRFIVYTPVHIRYEHDESASTTSNETVNEGKVKPMEPYLRTTVEAEQSSPQSYNTIFMLKVLSEHLVS